MTWRNKKHIYQVAEMIYANETLWATYAIQRFQDALRKLFINWHISSIKTMW